MGDAPLARRIRSDLTGALKRGATEEVDTLRFCIAELTRRQIEKRSGGEHEALSDDEVVDVLGREAKQRREAITLFKQGNRADLSEKEERSLTFIERYLPRQADVEEIEAVIEALIADGTTKLGPLMGATMARLKGRADGRLVREIVMRKLA